MFRTTIKAIILVTLFLAIASYAVYLKTGQFWVPSVSQFTRSFSMPEFLQKPVSMEPVTAPTATTYKWFLNGRWHYGDTPPEGVNAITLASDSKQ